MLEFVRRDALAAIIPALAIPVRVDLRALPVGRREDGQVWLVRVHGTHVLIAGATGAGKASLLWSIVRAMLPAMVAGLVRIWAADPKLMELAYGRAIFDRFGRYAATPEAIAAMLEDAVAAMQARAALFAGKHREHTPTIEHPFIVILVDEVAFLTAYLSDRAIRDRIKAALATLTTQGRAVGYCVIAALQDPRKEVMSIRNLFPDRIAMRLDEPEQVDMVLGDGARDRGATADLISTDETPPAPGWPMSGWQPTPTRSGSGPPGSPTPTSAPWPPNTPRPQGCARCGLMPHDRPHHLADRRPLPPLRRSSDRDLRPVQRPCDPAVPGLRLVGHLGCAAAGADRGAIGLPGRHGRRRDRLPPRRRHRLPALPAQFPTADCPEHSSGHALIEAYRQLAADLTSAGGEA